MARKRRVQKNRGDGLEFLRDKRLRDDIRIALGFSSYLIRNSARAERYYKRELRRAIILYVASVVEALRLFLIKTNRLSVQKVEYRYPRTITMPGVTVDNGKNQVIALQEKIPFSLRETRFFDAINTLRKSRIITSAFAKRLHVLRVRRNSQHLYGRSSKDISAVDVRSAFSILQHIFKIIHRQSSS